MNRIGIFPLAQAERLISLAAEDGITVEKFHNQQTCRSGCSITVELWAHTEDLEAIGKIWAKDQQRNYIGLEFDPQQVQQVYDPNNDSAVCPACGTEFSTALTECPDCGLSFSV
ncbi:MAG: hypothetical protein ACOH5I_01750 [Oligoflexus sp.]